ncbi:MAG: alpha-L-fucosidase [Clostridia bacterium]|nr:alpha-L-fucosidase [Clostridia bacterium]
MNNAEWFKQAKYGLMVHFGIYSMLEGSYRGKRGSSYAEWIEANKCIPNSEIERLAAQFNPIYFDAEEWVLFAKSCGMQYIVLTSKHHEGFALFRSEADKFNCYDACPLFRRDIVGELAEACRKLGLRLGLYYSQDLDWHEEHGGGYLSRHIPCAGVSWDNSWDWPDASKKDFGITYKRKILPQIKEILTKYGDICLIWFDVPMTVTEEQSAEIYRVVKELQPECLVSSRLGNGKYDYVSLGDNEIPEKMEIDPDKEVDYNSLGGFKPSPLGLYESACTLNHSWGFSALDHDYKSAAQIYENKKRLNAMGINYLINVGPDHLGRIPCQAQEILRGVAELEKAAD